MVHGVVVQITRRLQLGSAGQAEGRGQLAADCDARNGKPTSMVEDGLVGVFDFRFGQRRAAVEAPVHRLEAA
jgi:hypothetical protein